MTRHKGSPNRRPMWCGIDSVWRPGRVISGQDAGSGAVAPCPAAMRTGCAARGNLFAAGETADRLFLHCLSFCAVLVFCRGGRRREEEVTEAAADARVHHGPATEQSVEDHQSAGKRSVERHSVLAELVAAAMVAPERHARRFDSVCVAHRSALVDSPMTRRLSRTNTIEQNVLACDSGRSGSAGVRFAEWCAARLEELQNGLGAPDAIYRGRQVG